MSNFARYMAKELLDESIKRSRTRLSSFSKSFEWKRETIIRNSKEIGKQAVNYYAMKNLFKGKIPGQEVKNDNDRSDDNVTGDTCESDFASSMSGTPGIQEVDWNSLKFLNLELLKASIVTQLDPQMEALNRQFMDCVDQAKQSINDSRVFEAVSQAAKDCKFDQSTIPCREKIEEMLKWSNSFADEYKSVLGEKMGNFDEMKEKLGSCFDEEAFKKSMELAARALEIVKEHSPELQKRAVVLICMCISCGNVCPLPEDAIRLTKFLARFLMKQAEAKKSTEDFEC